MTSNGVFSVGILILFYTCYSAPHETFAGALIHKKMFSLSLFILNIYCDQNYCIVQGLLFLNYFKCIVQYIFVYLIAATSPTFYPFVMLGGICYMIACFPVPIVVRCVGLGIGLLLWSTSGMVICWASDRCAVILKTQCKITGVT